MMGPVTAAAVLRDPVDWIEDMTWHRRMFSQSHFRWVPEDPMSIALTWTRGRCAYSTPGQLRRLDEQLLSLRDYSAGIDDAMIEPLADAKRRSRPADYTAGLQLVGMTPTDVAIIRHSALSGRVTHHREAARALRGIPLPNPFSQVWELRQMRGMYAAAENLLEDTFCDLAVELMPAQGWDNLAKMTLYHRTSRTLQARIQEQRETRGGPGDPRRLPEQRY